MEAGGSGKMDNGQADMVMPSFRALDPPCPCFKCLTVAVFLEPTNASIIDTEPSVLVQP